MPGRTAAHRDPTRRRLAEPPLADALRRRVESNALCGSVHNSEYERALIRSRTKAALKAKRARGERAGSVPFGFDADAGGRLQPVTEEQSALSLMLQLRGDGLSYRGIAAELEKRGVAPKRGSRWHPSSVRSILLTADAAA